MACQVDLYPAIRLSDNEYSFYNMPLANWHHALQTLSNGRTSQSCDSVLWLHTPEFRIELGNDLAHGYNVPRGEEVWVSLEGRLGRPMRRNLASLLTKVGLDCGQSVRVLGVTKFEDRERFTRRKVEVHASDADDTSDRAPTASER